MLVKIFPGIYTALCSKCFKGSASKPTLYLHFATGQRASAGVTWGLDSQHESKWWLLLGFSQSPFQLSLVLYLPGGVAATLSPQPRRPPAVLIYKILSSFASVIQLARLPASTSRYFPHASHRGWEHDGRISEPLRCHTQATENKGLGLRPPSAEAWHSTVTVLLHLPVKMQGNPKEQSLLNIVSGKQGTGNLCPWLFPQLSDVSDFFPIPPSHPGPFPGYILRQHLHSIFHPLKTHFSLQMRYSTFLFGRSIPHISTATSTLWYSPPGWAFNIWREYLESRKHYSLDKAGFHKAEFKAWLGLHSHF